MDAIQDIDTSILLATILEFWLLISIFCAQLGSIEMHDLESGGLVMDF